MATIGLASQVGISVIKEGSKINTPPVLKRYNADDVFSIEPHTTLYVNDGFVD